MRRTAKSGIPNPPGSLLDISLQESFSQVEEELQQAEIHFHLGQYRKQVRKTLKPVAAEMEKLAERLTYSKRTGKLANEQVVGTEKHIQYEVREIGLRGLTEGLLVQPTVDSFEINLDGLPEGCTVQGDWYPYEVQFEDILFVLDDDGSICVSVENLPERLVGASANNYTKSPEGYTVRWTQLTELENRDGKQREQRWDRNSFG